MYVYVKQCLLCCCLLLLLLSFAVCRWEMGNIRRRGGGQHGAARNSQLSQLANEKPVKKSGAGGGRGRIPMPCQQLLLPTTYLLPTT
jgi:hypothetical protein